MKPEILFLGIGNDILCDDAIGPKIVYRLKKDLGDNNRFFFHTAAVGGLEVLEYIKEYKRVIIIDAIMTRDGIPGTIYFLSPEHFKETLHLSSFHDVNFLTALEIGKRLNINIPEIIDIIAIEIVEDREFSNDFSPVIQEKYEEIYSTVLEEIKGWLKM